MRGNLRVLVVDDDDVDFMQTERLLARRYGDRLALTRSRAVDDALAECRDGIFDIAIVDINLGARTGLDVLRAIGRSDRPFPMIALTGFDSDEVRQAALAEGCAGCIGKNDLTSDALGAAVDSAIGER